MSTLTIEHAILYETLGRSRQSGRFTFVAAHADIFDLQTCGPTHDVLKFFEYIGTAYTDLPFPEHEDRLWARARFPRVFGFSPLRAANNCAPIVDVAFFAITEVKSSDDLVAWPFVCTVGFHPDDSLLEEPIMGLLFSDHGPSADQKDKIAHSFWRLVADEPNDLAYFSDYEYNAGCGYWYLVGCNC